MKRTLLSVGLALSLTAGAAMPASAQDADQNEATTPSSGSSTDDGSSVAGAGALIALAAAAGGGAWWAVQQGLIPNPLPGVIPGPPAPAPAPARGDCSAQAFNAALWEWRDSNRTVVEHCDGRFAWVSQSQTDWRVAFEFDGQRWVVSRPAGTKRTGMTQGCYNGIELRNKGASDAFLSRLPICTPDEIGYSPW